MDPRWAVATLFLTAIVGMVVWLVLMVLIESRAVSKKAKRIWSAVALVGFMVWLFTLGDPHSSVNIEVLYYKSINYLPDSGFTKILKKGQPARLAPQNTNASATVQTNK